MTSTSRQGAEPILLAFSGGLDTSFCVPWLRDTYQRPVITVTVDTGGIDPAAARSLAERSVQLGAIEHHLIDARAAYFDQVLKYLLMGNVRRGGVYPLCVGAAQSVAVAIDTARWPEVVGTLSGDDTIFIATAGAREQRKLAERLLAIFGR